MSTQRVRFRLSIPAREYLRFYQGQARAVIVRGYDGRRIQFPADALRGHVTREGIHGEFELRFDDRHRLVGLFRIDD